MKKTAIAIITMILLSPLFGETKGEVYETFEVNEGFFWISVKVRAPIPEEVANETQALAISKNAAVGIAQMDLLNHVLKKKTRSGKTLEEAQIPSLDLQERIKGKIKGAKIEWVKWKDGYCYLKMTLSKKSIKKILKEN